MATTTSTPAIFEVADRFRDDLDKATSATSSRLVDAYGASWKRLDVERRTLLKAYEAAQAAGVDTSPSWAMRLERYQSLQDQLAREMSGFVATAGVAQVKAQKSAVAAAQAHAEALVSVGLGANQRGGAVSFRRLPSESLRDLLGFTGAGSPLHELLGEAGEKARRQATRELLVGMAMGHHPNRVAARFKENVDGALWRARTIARTEFHRAYRETHRRAYLANPHVVGGWVWHARLDTRTCAACWAMHGTIHPSDERLSGHPNCRCTPVPATKTWAELGFPGIPETRPPVQRGPEVFAQLTPGERVQVLGPLKAAKYEAGELKLEDVVGLATSDEWGPHYYARSWTRIDQGVGSLPDGLVYADYAIDADQAVSAWGGVSKAQQQAKALDVKASPASLPDPDPVEVDFLATSLSDDALQKGIAAVDADPSLATPQAQANMKAAAAKKKLEKVDPDGDAGANLLGKDPDPLPDAPAVPAPSPPAPPSVPKPTPSFDPDELAQMKAGLKKYALKQEGGQDPLGVVEDMLADPTNSLLEKKALQELHDEWVLHPPVPVEPPLGDPQLVNWLLAQDDPLEAAYALYDKYTPASHFAVDNLIDDVVDAVKKAGGDVADELADAAKTMKAAALADDDPAGFVADLWTTEKWPDGTGLTPYEKVVLGEVEDHVDDVLAKKAVSVADGTPTPPAPAVPPGKGSVGPWVDTDELADIAATKADPPGWLQSIVDHPDSTDELVAQAKDAAKLLKAKAANVAEPPPGFVGKVVGQIDDAAKPAYNAAVDAPVMTLDGINDVFAVFKEKAQNLLNVGEHGMSHGVLEALDAWADDVANDVAEKFLNLYLKQAAGPGKSDAQVLADALTAVNDWHASAASLSPTAGAKVYVKAGDHAVNILQDALGDPDLASSLLSKVGKKAAGLGDPGPGGGPSVPLPPLNKAGTSAKAYVKGVDPDLDAALGKLNPGAGVNYPSLDPDDLNVIVSSKWSTGGQKTAAKKALAAKGEGPSYHGAPGTAVPKPSAKPAPSTAPLPPVEKGKRFVGEFHDDEDFDRLPFATDQLKKAPPAEQISAGAHTKTVLEAPDGTLWLWKPQDRFRADLDVIAARIQKAAGLRHTPTYSVEMDGRWGSLQRLHAKKADRRDRFRDGNYDPLKADADLTAELQRHHVFDWLVGNHDAHEGQFMRVSGSMDTIEVDLGQAFKFFGSDRLDPDYAPNSAYGVDSVYNKLHRAWRDGRDVAGFTDLTAPGADASDLAMFIRQLQGMSDRDYERVLRPYAEAAARRRMLARGTSFENDVDGFLAAAVTRKNSLLRDLTEMHRDLAKARIKATGFDPSAVPAGLKGLAHSWVDSTDSWARQQFPSSLLGKLTAKSVDAVKAYTGSGYGSINRGLWTHGGALSKLSATVRGWVEGLDDAFRTIGRANKHDFRVVRYTGSDAFDRPMDQLLGTVQVADNFLSTSVGTTPKYGTREVYMRIRVPAGTPGAYVATLSSVGGHELEYLLGRGAKFYVHKVTRGSGPHGSSKWEMDVEILPEGLDPKAVVTSPSKLDRRL